MKTLEVYQLGARKRWGARGGQRAALMKREIIALLALLAASSGCAQEAPPAPECTRNESADTYCSSHHFPVVAWTCPGWTAVESQKVGCLYLDNDAPDLYCCE
jgi:hypothetical protein